MESISNYDDIQFIFKEKQNFEGCTLLNGWHGIGECGFISISHIVDKLGAERIGFIITDNLPQFITIKNKKITFPFEIYRKDDLVIVLPIFEPIKTEHLKFTKTIVEWSIEEKFKQTILVGGLDRRLQDENRLKVIYTQNFLKENPSLDLPILDEGLYVTGPLAYLLMFYELKNFPALSLLPYAERSRPDPVAASVAVEEISKVLNTPIEVEGLLEQAEKIEKEIQSLLQASKTKTGKENDTDKGMFV